MSIDPKVSTLINLVITVLGALAGASAEWTSLFGQGKSQQIVAVMGMAVTVLGAVNTGLHGVSSPVAGPLVKTTLGPRGDSQ
jgi:uncharacterized membrane protein YuzA (DUF378 family)